MREETCYHHYMSYSFQLPAWIHLYEPSFRQDSTYHSLYTPVMGHWLEREIAQLATMRDQSNDPSHYECMHYHRAKFQFTLHKKLRQSQTQTGIVNKKIELFYIISLVI